MLRQVLKHARSGKAQSERRLTALRDDLLTLQKETCKAQSFSSAVIVTGIPAAGRSETVNRLLQWLDPKFVTVHAFGAPAPEEKQRPPMWKYWQTLPARGRIAFYFGGWYGDYMAQALHDSRSARPGARRVLQRIRQFESMLTCDGVRILKIHLHIDAKTQRKRLAKLRADKLTRWRVTCADLWLARHYKQVARTLERCLKGSEQPAAPWHLIDGTDEEYRLLTAGEILRNDLRRGLAHSANRPRSSAARAVVKTAVLPARGLPQFSSQDDYERDLQNLQGRLALLARRKRFQERALVLAFEGMDAAGKGGAIRRITHALDARQYQVVPVSAPTPEERLHPYLWRFWRAVPRQGHIAIFDRSWYGRVLVERVRSLTAAADWRRAYEEIRQFERQLAEHGIVIAKLWLDVSEAEQLKRFKAREADPLKRFKVDPEDWKNRSFYSAYQVAAAEMIRRTHAPYARWTVVPADDKKTSRLQVLQVVCDTLERAMEESG